MSQVPLQVHVCLQSQIINICILGLAQRQNKTDFYGTDTTDKTLNADRQYG